MSDDCHHAPAPRRGIGIPREGDFDPVAFEKAVGDLLRACGVS
ncbi:MAG TPA: GTP cyclohydrolase I FolE, partial [Denitromonas sp.]|nr:GTP cyclohydrolase I FolE [Denitromonas sp.]